MRALAWSPPQHPQAMSQSTKARRCPPSASMSVPPQKRRKIDRASSSSATSDSTSSPEDIGEAVTKQFTIHHASGGESAGVWFDNDNKNIYHDALGDSPYDEEPPFYMARQEPYRQLPQSGAPSRAFGEAAPQIVADSEKADLRDVIDDLTIENMMLKKKLRSHKSRTSRATNSRSEDMLFELRVHGMRVEKKRELEALLKNFAMTLGKDTVPSRSAASRGPDQLASYLSLSMSEPGAQNAKLVHTDSGYGSNSNSGNHRHAVSGPSASKDHTIKSYLHDIPDVLLPRDSYQISDKVKMAVVVRRLEQLFTGKQAAPGDHQHPVRQQEMSRSAANADRRDNNLRSENGWTEGSREAHIVPVHANITFDVSEAPSPAKTLHAKINGDKLMSIPDDRSASGPSRSGSPDQRPTRPLDLDIGRAQLAQENIEYIRHLGLPAPGFDQNGAKKDQWIYLNLLVSMAQLHTLNVTPDFVRRAVKKHSTKFELSKDQCSMRWRGGADATIFSKETEQAMEQTATAYADPVIGKSVGGKISKTDGPSNGQTSFSPSDGQRSRQESSNAIEKRHSTLETSYSSKPQVSIQNQPLFAFDYKPMFYKPRTALRREASSFNDSTSSAATDSVELADQLSRSDISGQSKRDGMLTFFSSPYFCSDLSADKHSTNYVRNELSALAIFNGRVLGIPDTDAFLENVYREHDACYFAPQFAAKFKEPKHEPPLQFQPQPIMTAGEDKTQPMEMEASGLGMTVPADNFAVDVKVCRENVSGRRLLQPKSHLQRQTLAGLEYHVQSAQHIDLQASHLPSPSYMFFTSSSSSNFDAMDDDEDDNTDSSSSVDEISPSPLAFMQHFSTESSGDCGSDEYLEDDDSSLDKLQAAQADNRERLAAQEREYLLSHPGAAMEDISPSLAATVGTPSVYERRESAQQGPRSDVSEISDDESDDDDEE